jgi:hypothetical protein
VGDRLLAVPHALVKQFFFAWLSLPWQRLFPCGGKNVFHIPRGFVKPFLCFFIFFSTHRDKNFFLAHNSVQSTRLPLRAAQPKGMPRKYSGTMPFPAGAVRARPDIKAMISSGSSTFKAPSQAIAGA